MKDETKIIVDEIKRKALYLELVIFNAVAGFAFYFVFLENYWDMKYKQLYQEVSIEADINKDGVTTVEEWKEVYKKLGVQFDELNPIKLSENRLNEYLGRNQKNSDNKNGDSNKHIEKNRI